MLYTVYRSTIINVATVQNFEVMSDNINTDKFYNNDL